MSVVRPRHPGGRAAMPVVRCRDRAPAHLAGSLESRRMENPDCLGKYPVTQQQWKAVMGNLPEMNSHPKRVNVDPGNPVLAASWDDCQVFLRKLNDEFSPGQPHFRLPTEPEWEFACRAGTRTRWSFGDDESQLGDYAWYRDNAKRHSRAVGQKKPNPWGLYDMHGNVWQWCEDWHACYPGPRSVAYPVKFLVVDPRGPESGTERVARGGSWCCDAEASESKTRMSAKPDARYENFGLRIAWQ
jgi:formylglycine-generating enzyme required for sulfatase activity